MNRQVTFVAPKLCALNLSSQSANRSSPTFRDLGNPPQAKSRLRALCLPITLFGETHKQRCARLLLAEEDKGHHQDDFTLADGHNVVSIDYRNSAARKLCIFILWSVGALLPRRPGLAVFWCFCPPKHAPALPTSPLPLSGSIITLHRSRTRAMQHKNNEFLGNVSTDLTGSHLDAATGRDEELTAKDGKGVDDSDDDDDDDEDGAGARAARQATKTGKGKAGGDGSGAGGAGGGGGSSAGAGGGGAAGGGDGGAAGAASEAALDGEVKEMERNKLVRTFFRGLLKEWEMDLNKRPDHVKRTVQGKLETKTQKQAKDYMRPLFKLCKQKVRVPSSVCVLLHCIECRRLCCVSIRVFDVGVPAVKVWAVPHAMECPRELNSMVYIKKLKLLS